ncbi:MAG TPA: hypothetical protein VN963_10705 [bacterium]|nr:hypothetical protein [bacterium]
MNFVRKNLFLVALAVLSSLTTALIAVSFHHHETTENHDCSLCNWQSTTSQSYSNPVPPALFPVTWILLFFLFKTSQFSSSSKTSQSGRDPPKNLL